MKKLLDEHRPTGLLYDIGSFQVNRTYRDIVPCEYKGIDICPGRNVDIVVPEDGDWSHLPQADMVISGQCLEHVKRPWQWMRQVASVLKLDRKLIIIVPWKWNIHRHPVDCWRVLPDGMRVLLEDFGFEVVEVGAKHVDTYGVGIRKF